MIDLTLGMLAFCFAAVAVYAAGLMWEAIR